MTKPVTLDDLASDDYGPLYAARKKVYPQSTSGTFRRIKWALMAFCLAVYYLLPFVRWNRGLGAPRSWLPLPASPWQAVQLSAKLFAPCAASYPGRVGRPDSERT